MKRSVCVCFLVAVLFVVDCKLFAKTDTLRLMAYNVLYYGNGCQGPNQYYHDYLKTIINFVNPDIIGLDKLASISVAQGDKFGTAPLGFADSILKYSLNAAFPNRYAYCNLTNRARSGSMSVLFYDQNKLGYIGIVCSYANITDFTTYKLYYKDPDLFLTHDTTFLYIAPVHDRSGDENENVRGIQIGEEIRTIKEHFTSLPNMVNMGDFNSRSSGEPFYKLLTAPEDTGFRFFDPPFFPDRKLKYPANWDHEPEYSKYFTTSTRESAEVPNSCGTGGGAKNWYDHIFLSPSLVYNTDRIAYVPGTYKTVGNDGQRLKVSINNRNSHINTSAPHEVIEALYRMSNKYPVTADLIVDTKRASVGFSHTEKYAAKVFYKEEVSFSEPIDNNLKIHFPADMLGQDFKLTCTSAAGAESYKKKFKVTDLDFETNLKLAPGNYTLKLVGHHNLIAEQLLIIK